MSVLINYTDSRGAGVSKRFASMAQGGGTEIERLYKRRCRANAYALSQSGELGEQVGYVWKQDGRWTYAYDQDA